MKSCFCTIGFQKNKWGQERVLENPLSEILPRVAQSGFDGVEIWEPHIGAMSAAQQGETRRQLDDLGLEVAMISPYFDFTSSEESAARSVDEGMRVLEAARCLESRAVRCFTGKTASADATDEQWQRAARSLRQLADASAADGILWALETHSWNLMDSVEGALRLLRETDHPNVRLIFQPSTFKINYLEALALLGAHVCHIHATNSRDKAPASLGGGEIDYAEIVARLRSLGFDGYVSVEYMGDEPERVAREEGPYLRRLLG